MGQHWQSTEARELAGSRGVGCPVRAVRHHVADLLDEAGTRAVPVRFGPIFRLVGVRRVREKKMVLEGGLRRLKSGRYDIWVRRDRPSTRRRFSVAHELGHLLFHHHAPVSKARQVELGSQAPQEEERLCNVAAAEILMPEWFVEQLLRREPDELARAVVDLSRACDTSLASALIRLAQGVESRGVLQLWRRLGGKGWQLIVRQRTGRPGIRLDTFEVDGWRESIADSAARTGRWSQTGYLFSTDLRTVAPARSVAIRAPSSDKNPMVVLHHRLGRFAKHRQTSALANYRQKRYERARATRPDPNCQVCRGSGWEHLEERNAVRVCRCRYHPTANKAA